MESWGVFFLGVIALCAVVQAVFLVGILGFGRKLAERLDMLQARLDRELSPALGNFTRLSRSAAEIADMATEQARRVVKPIGGMMALLKGVQRGMDVYFASDRDALPDRRTHPRSRGHVEDDEHLFV